jgi:hypothetical protein
MLFAFGFQDGIRDPDWWQIAQVFPLGLALTGWVIGNMRDWGEGVGCLAAPVIVSLLILVVRFGNPWSVILIGLLAFPAGICGFLQVVWPECCVT